MLQNAGRPERNIATKVAGSVIPQLRIGFRGISEFEGTSGRMLSLVAEVLGVRTDDIDIWHHAIRAEPIVVTCNRQDFLDLAGTAPEPASSF